MPTQNQGTTTESSYRFSIHIMAYKTTDMAQANAMKEKLENDGFTNVMVLKQKKRLRVCVERFDTADSSKAIKILRKLKSITKNGKQVYRNAEIYRVR